VSSHSRQCPLIGEPLLKRIPSTSLCRGVLLMFPHPCRIDWSHLPTTTSLSSRRNTIAAAGEPPSTLLSPLDLSSSSKAYRAMRHEPWMLIVNSCSPVDHRSRPTGWATPCRAPLLGWASQAECHYWAGLAGCAVALGRALEYILVARGLNEIPFHFPFGLNSSLNLENSYLSVQSSQNHETNFVGFLISKSIHEKC
jgi:hypothetical protein